MMNTHLHASAQHEPSQQAQNLLGQDSLRAICTAPGPFITIFLPARHPGAADLPRTQGLRTVIRDAARELERRGFQGSIDELLKPLKELADNPASLAGGSESVIFVGPGWFRHFALPMPSKERLFVASHPHVTTILGHLIRQKEFYILAIAKKLLRLGRWHNGQCTEVALPAGVPKNFEEYMVFDQPDHDLQSRTAGPTRFGIGSERDQVHNRLRQYFQIVDCELTGFLKDAPLVLVGITQELAAYCSVAGYARLLSAKPTSPEHLTWDQLKQRGQEAVLEAQRGEVKKVLGELRETASRDHVNSGVREVLEAAHKGRVHKLLLEDDVEHRGLLGPSFALDSEHLEGEQDLINAAAVETIRKHGEVFIVDRGELGASGPVAAILRYSD